MREGSGARPMKSRKASTVWKTAMPLPSRVRQPSARTLSDAEIEAAGQKIVAAVVKATGATLRGVAPRFLSLSHAPGKPPGKHRRVPESTCGKSRV